MKDKISKLFVWALSGFGRLVILATVVFILFNIGRSIWKNWQVNQNIISSQKEISSLTKENQNLQNQILYYQTETFKELEARRKLNLKKPGENLVIVPENVDTNSSNSLTKTTNNLDQLPLVPNPVKWWNFTMGK